MVHGSLKRKRESVRLLPRRSSSAELRWPAVAGAGVRGGTGKAA